VFLFVAPLAGLALDALLQMILVRIVAGDAHVRLQFVAFGTGMILTATLLAGMLWQVALPMADRVGYLALHCAAYACLGFGLFNVINANVSSLRVRMLKEYLANDPVPLPDEAVYRRYPAREILEARLGRLERGGQIEARGGRLYLRGGAVVRIGHFFAALQRLLLRA
jgi:hypothetical protein